MEDEFQKLFCTIAEAITFVTLLVSLGKWLTDYYLVYFVLITVSVIFGFELHKYKENQKAKEALRILKSYSSCSVMSTRGHTRQTITKPKNTTPQLSDKKKTSSFSETKKLTIKSKLKGAKNFNSIGRKNISKDQKSASTLHVDFVDSSLKRPKSLSSIVTLKKKENTKSIPNLSMNNSQQQLPSIKKGVLKRSPRSLSNLLTLGKNNNKKTKKETKFKLDEIDNASTDSSSIEVVIKKNVTLRQKLKSKMDRVVELQKRRSLPAEFTTATINDTNNNTPNRSNNPDDFNENEDIENLKKIIKVSAM